MFISRGSRAIVYEGIRGVKLASGMLKNSANIASGAEERMMRGAVKLS
jgi:hypothetical protein